MDADEHVLGAVDLALDHRHVVFVVDQRAVADRGEVAEGGRQRGRDDPLDQLLGAAPVGDQLGDGDHLQAVLLAVGDQVGDAGHRAVVVHHLADHPGRGEAGEAGEVDAGLGVAGALQHAALFGPQREHVAGDDDVARARVGVDRDLDRVGAVVGGDAGADPAGGLDRDREGGLQRRLVLGRHQVEAEPFAALGGQRQADQPARLLGHEVDRLGGGELRRHHQVALVLAVLAVADDDHAAAADLLDRLLDRRERALPRLGRRVLVSGSPSSGSRSLLSGEWCHQPLHVLRHDVALDVQLASRRELAEVRPLQGLGDQRDLDPILAQLGDREADAVEGDRALVDRVAQQLGREADAEAAGEAVLLDRRATSPTPSTWPWTMWPPSRSEACIASSRLTRAPASRPPSAVTSSVWFIASVSKPSASAAVAVRQTPLTATESPRAISAAEARWRCAGGRRRAPRSTRLDRADVLDQPGEHLTTP